MIAHTYPVWLLSIWLLIKIRSVKVYKKDLEVTHASTDFTLVLYSIQLLTVYYHWAVFAFCSTDIVSRSFEPFPLL